MSLAHRLKRTRKKHGLSQAELARKVDVSQPTIANWERGGHIPRPDAMSRIAEALGTDPAWLMSGEHPAASNPAHKQLAKPIHQIPVHEWPGDVDDPAQAQTVRYIAIAAESGGLLALSTPEMPDFPRGTILIFSKSNRTLPGRYLVRQDGEYRIVERHSLDDDVFARLVYSVMAH